MQDQHLKVLTELNKLQRHLLQYDKQFVTDRYIKGLRGSADTAINDLYMFINRIDNEIHSEMNR